MIRLNPRVPLLSRNLKGIRDIGSGANTEQRGDSGHGLPLPEGNKAKTPSGVPDGVCYDCFLKAYLVGTEAIVWRIRLAIL